MTTDTNAVARWNSWGGEIDIQESDTGQFVLFTDHERVVGELTANAHELERLCDTTYVAQGADAYNHACDLIEQLQAERIGKGRDPGTEGSLCDGLTWAYGELLESEDECETLSTALAASRAEVEGLREACRAIKELRENTEMSYEDAYYAMFKGEGRDAFERLYAALAKSTGESNV